MTTIQEKLTPLFDAVGVRIIKIKKSISFGESIYTIYPHIADLYTCDFDKLMDSIEALGFKTDNTNTTIKIK